MLLLCSINARGLGPRKLIFINDFIQRVQLDLARFFDALFSDLRILDGFCAEDCGLPSYNI